MAEFPFKAAENAEPAQWLVERMTPFGEKALSIVPSGFEAYARVFHPASKITCTEDGGMETVSEPLRWAEVAALTGRISHRSMQWPSIRGANPSLNDYTVLKAGDVYIEAPKEGTLPLGVSQILWPLLEPHTQTFDKCFFATWEGFGGLPLLVSEAPAFETPGRRYHLFEAPISNLTESFYSNLLPVGPGRSMFFTFHIEQGKPYPSEAELEAMTAKAEAEYNDLLKNSPPQYQSANLMWPQNRAWCLATEIDFDTTYIVGTQLLIDDLPACEGLEVYQVEPEEGLTDTVNPQPLYPYGGNFRLER